MHTHTHTHKHACKHAHKHTQKRTGTNTRRCLTFAKSWSALVVCKGLVWRVGLYVHVGRRFSLDVSAHVYMHCMCMSVCSACALYVRVCMLCMCMSVCSVCMCFICQSIVRRVGFYSHAHQRFSLRVRMCMSVCSVCAYAYALVCMCLYSLRQDVVTRKRPDCESNEGP